jgi:3-methylcrotonyl-CoA carboxylase alpha subunit
MFKKLLVANRGEIACRIMRTAKAMRIQTVAVYSEADLNAQHVRQADEAYLIGPAPSRDSYLNVDAVLAAAQTSGADAVHPGYGFLSENAAFAEACVRAGIAFVGPPVSAMQAMSRKDDAKRLLAPMGVPMLPGHYEAIADLVHLTELAEKVGYPLLLKAAAGGGGRGMRIVRAKAELADAWQAAQREAAASFGSADVIIEKYLERPRHIEVQILADQHGQVLYLGDRDCSIQRRHQKIIEEAPAPGLSDELRRTMGETAVTIAKHIGYQGAGTIEFLWSDDAYYFMEMNTRLQVEHPVTEMITGLDLVEWQLRVAAGEKLPWAQKDIRYKGHAIEARLCAEDPAAHFMPASGHLTYCRWPSDIRVDAGFVSGDTVSVYYDSLLAKCIAYAPTRAEAIADLQRGLDDTRIIGVANNRDFLRGLLQHPAFQNDCPHTDFIARFQEDCLQEKDCPVEVLQAVSINYPLPAYRPPSPASGRGESSPWATLGAWQHVLPSYLHYTWQCGGKNYLVEIECFNQARYFIYNGQRTPIASNDPHLVLIEIYPDKNTRHAFWRGEHFALHLESADEHAGEADGVENLFVAPLPATVTAVPVKAQQAVKKGEVLIVLEAMKMEHSLTAPSDGLVEAIYFAVGDIVKEGTTLLVFTPNGEKVCTS